MDKVSLGKQVLRVSYLEGDFLLRSGKRSRYYLDKYLFETDPRVLRGICQAMGALITERSAVGLGYQRLGAPELGAVSLGAGLSLELDIPFVIVRKGAKEYGTGRGVEGSWKEGDRVAVVEDIVTSGGASLQAVHHLRKLGMTVEDLFCVVNREEGGKEAAEAAGVHLVSLFTATELGIKKS